MVRGMCLSDMGSAEPRSSSQPGNNQRNKRQQSKTKSNLAAAATCMPADTLEEPVTEEESGCHIENVERGLFVFSETKSPRSTDAHREDVQV